MLTVMGRALARFAVVTVTVSVSLTALALVEERPAPVRLPRTGSAPTFTTVVVARGDHLWKISERHLQTLMGREVHGTEVSPYWRRVIEANRGRLRSGDPNLIYPGEVVSLPPFSNASPKNGKPGPRG